MRLELPAERLKARRAQLVEIDGGLVIKRGCVEVKVLGDGASVIVPTLLAAAGEGASREEMLAGIAVAERATAEALIDHLVQRRLLMPASDGDAVPPQEESSADVFYWHFGKSDSEVRKAVAARRITIVGINDISRRLAESLAGLGFASIELRDDPVLRNAQLFDERGSVLTDAWDERLSRPMPLDGGPAAVDLEGIDCLVATSDLGAMTGLGVWNEYCHLHKTLFLPIVLRDLIGSVGPLVVPGETACLECVRLRERTHQVDPMIKHALHSATKNQPSSAGFVTPMASILGDLAALELLKFFSLGPPAARAGSLVEVNLIGPEVSARKVLRLPRCPVCTPLEERPSLSVTRNPAEYASGGRS